jgi:hypothetical protein
MRSVDLPPRRRVTERRRLIPIGQKEVPGARRLMKVAVSLRETHFLSRSERSTIASKASHC